MKKTIVFAMCLSILLCGCSASASKSDSSASSSQSSQADSSDEVKKLKEQVNNLAELTAQNLGVSKEDLLSGKVDPIDIDGEIHAIYDDTAVVEAYNSGDDSKLTDEKDKFILKSLKEAVSEIIKDNMTEYEKEKAVYDYMYKNTHLDESSLAAIPDNENNYSHTPYGFFHNHSTICVGNATTFKLFMDVLGIDCKIIHSTSEGEHAWNVVKINDKWYHCDTMFDGGAKEPDYAYFNVPDEAKKYDSYPWNESDFPACTSVDDCYMYKKATEVKSIYEVPKAIKKAIDKKSKSAYIKFKLKDGQPSDEQMSEIRSIYSEIAYSISGMEQFSLNMSNLFISNGYVVMSLDIYNTEDLRDDDDSGNEQTLMEKYGIDINKLSKSFSDSLSKYGISLELGYMGDGEYDQNNVCSSAKSEENTSQAEE